MSKSDLKDYLLVFLVVMPEPNGNNSALKNGSVKFQLETHNKAIGKALSFLNQKLREEADGAVIRGRIYHGFDVVRSFKVPSVH